MMRSLDLFSGIGGLALALHGVATPVAYCDSWDVAQQVLRANMRRRWLPRAPICEDVRALDATWLRQNLPAATGVDIVVGGFPCTGFSTIGVRGGLGDEQSVLFFEIVRILDVLAKMQGQNQAPLVFMENVAGVLYMAMDVLAHEFGRRKYNMRWCCLPASAMGAPHRRMRWYCVAYQPGNRRHLELLELAAARLGPASKVNKKDPWGSPPPIRMRSDVPTKTASMRFSSLGNSVVPPAARHAFASIVRGITTNNGSRQATTDAGGAWPACGEFHHGAGGGRVLELAGMEPVRPPYKMSVVLDPRAYRPPASAGKSLIRTPLLVEPVTISAFNTPTSNNNRPSNYLTQRSSDDLPTQLRFARDTPRPLRKGLPNPEFVEWLMGFPLRWTQH